MAKVSVRRCDRCKAFDSMEIGVRRLHVIALRFDLCMNCCIVMLDELLCDAIRTTETVTRLFGVPVMDDDQMELVYDDATGAESARVADEALVAADSIGDE